MLERLIQFATGKRVLVSLFALAIGSSSIFMLGPYSSISRLNEERSLPEEQFSAPDTIEGFLERIGPQGRELYVNFQLLDILNSILICVFLVLLIAWLYKLSLHSERLRMLALVPLFILVVELWENSLLYMAATEFPATPAGIETLQLVFPLKFGGLGFSVVVALVLVSLAILRKVKVRARVS